MNHCGAMLMIDQAARHGPSMSVGTDPETWEIIKPYLEEWCAKAPNGEPCVNRMGPGGAGHCTSSSDASRVVLIDRRQDDSQRYWYASPYCALDKAADDPEHAHLSILCEIRGLLYHQLGMTNDEIANLFEQWFNDKVRHRVHQDLLIVSPTCSGAISWLESGSRGYVSRKVMELRMIEVSSKVLRTRLLRMLISPR